MGLLGCSLSPRLLGPPGPLGPASACFGPSVAVTAQVSTADRDRPLYYVVNRAGAGCEACVLQRRMYGRPSKRGVSPMASRTGHAQAESLIASSRVDTPLSAGSVGRGWSWQRGGTRRCQAVRGTGWGREQISGAAVGSAGVRGPRAAALLLGSSACRCLGATR